MCKCDVFDLKTSSWSSRPLYLKRDFRFEGDAGMFLNGFLYWATNFGILDLDVKEMVFSRIEHPDGLKYAVPLLGFVDGCLCVVNTIGATRFDLWVRKEQGVWLKARSFAIPLEACYFSDCCPVCILGNEKILLTTRTMGLFIYDTSNDTFKPLDGLTTGEYFKPTPSIFCFKDIRAIEYVESLVLPSHTCSSLLEKKHTCHLQGRFEVNQHNFDKMSCYVKL
ncbi:hypothetical protein L1987_36065 [Smallanthus sonchifolius]|uniref:Uncharacterized protein n=1 Tax=Smallanthus sonchifolius TaxID=185202 RepID=A0ACB9HD66_9ASTR|nr:hypothetical protein L1987_36065 [Smallanthus sonchifolius]